MSLVFSSDQLKSISKEVLSLPDTIAQMATLGVKAKKNKDAAKIVDDGNVVYQNNFFNIIHQLHTELALLSGIVKTDYDRSQLDLAAKSAPGNIHFLQGQSFFQPQVTPSNNGNPTSNISDHENQIIGQLNSWINLLKNGFTDGSSSQNISDPMSGNIITVSSVGGLAVGQKAVASGPGGFAYGIISNISSNDITLSNLLLSGTIGSGDTLSNFTTGFTNSYRESAHPTDKKFNTFVGALNDSSTAWLGKSSNQLYAIKANDAGDADTSAEGQNVANLISVIKSWQQGVSYGAGIGRYGDTKLNPFSVAAVGRVSGISNRIAQINIHLGAVSQAADGTFSGQGYYFQLFKWIDVRINIVTGSLVDYYNSDLGLKGNAQIIAASQQKLNEYSKQFVVSVFAEDSVATTKVKVKSVDGFAAGKTAYVIADDSEAISFKILSVSIIDKTLNFDKIVPASFKVSNNSRVMMQH